MSSKRKTAPAMKSAWEPLWLQKIHVPPWVVLVLAIVFILRIPSFFEPYYYGDEMIYLKLGEAIKRGMVLYRDIHDNKPPLLYFTAAVAGNVFWFRAILAGWMMVTIALFWKLTNALFPKNSLVVKAAVSAFAILTTLPLLEGQIANAEAFMIGPTIAAFYILLTKRPSPRNLIFSGFLLSIGTLFKMPSMFDIGAIIFLWVLSLKLAKKDVFRLVKHSLLLFIGFITPILVTFVWYFFRGALNEYFVAAFLQNIGYLSSWRSVAEQEPFLARNGPLLLRGGILLLGLGVLYFFRKKLSKPFVFAVAWLLFSLFAATLSERPYPHYLVQAVPAMSILIGLLLAAQTLEQSLSIIPLFLVAFALVKFQFWYYPTTSYYQRFISFTSGMSSREEYFKGFDKNVPRNYKIAEFLLTSSAPEDKVFVWGDSPAIYAMSRRFPPLKYIATYHIIDFFTQEKTIQALSENKPKFIVVLPDSPDFPLLSRFLQGGYLLIEDIDGARIWKVSSFEGGQQIYR